MLCSGCNKELLPPTDAYCPQCGKPVNTTNAVTGTNPVDGTANATNNNTDNMLLADVNRRLTELEKKIPTTKILAPGFWTRSWAVFGHTLVPTIIIYAILFILMLIIGLTVVHTLFPQYKSYL